MRTSKILRTARRANRLERAISDPQRYAEQRAKSKALGALGVWRLLSRFWRL